MTSRILDVQTTNHDLNKSLTELKEEYQVNVDKLKLENTTQGSKIIEVDLKLHQANERRDEFERVNRVLSEENTVLRDELDNLTKLLAAKDAKESIPIPKKSRNLVFDSDTSEDEEITMVNEPPDIGASGLGNPPPDFQVGR